MTFSDDEQKPEKARYPAGHPETLTANERSTLNSFRQALDNEKALEERDDDAYLCRFLRARKFNLEKAKEMFLEMKRWRKDSHVDEIYESYDYQERHEVFRYYPRYFHKTDKQDRPIYIEELGKLDMAELNRMTTIEKETCSKAAGKRIETIASIVDLKNVPFRQFWPYRPYLKAVSHIGQNYYPETLGTLLVINAPYFFSTVWGIAKSWLDEATTNKIVILGSDFHTKLSEYIDLDNLPERLGGKCQCPGGCEFSNAGLWQATSAKKEP